MSSLSVFKLRTDPRGQSAWRPPPQRPRAPRYPWPGSRPGDRLRVRCSSAFLISVLAPRSEPRNPGGLCGIATKSTRKTINHQKEVFHWTPFVSIIVFRTNFFHFDSKNHQGSTRFPEGAAHPTSHTAAADAGPRVSGKALSVAGGSARIAAQRRITGVNACRWPACPLEHMRARDLRAGVSACHACVLAG